ncbi:MAG: leucine-rich repeat protein [Clostridia bacterium]|nr:leucine-rich repeat protein [Clostridia bacterium]
MKKLRLLTVLSFIVGCLAVFACCTKPTLDTPDVETFKVNETTLVLTWAEIDDAKSYKIMVNTEEYNSKKPSYPMADLDAGVYTITVKAVSGNKDVMDSDWSETFTYEREAESGLSYYLINNKTEYAVRGIGSAKGDIVIDDVYRNKPVTKIADMAFANKSKDIDSVTIGANVKTIGSRAFYNCSNMVSVTFKSDKVTSIGAYAFQGCRALKEFTVPSQVTEIPNYAFTYCRSLETVNFNQGLTSIGEKAFDNCDKLNNVVIPDSVTSIGIYAFADNLALSNINLGNGLQVLKEYTFLNCQTLTNVTFGSGLKEIEQFAFSKCIALTSIDIPDTVTTIGQGAFHSCENLAEADLSDNLEKLGASAFAGTKLWTDSADGIVVVDGWIAGRNGKEIGNTVLNEGKIVDGIVGVADYSFNLSEDFTALGIPNSVKHIGERAFYNSKLTNLSIGSGVETIGVSAFSQCQDLRNVTIEDGSVLRIIDNYAFQSCKKLTLKSELPATIERIGTYAFENTSYWNQSPSLIYIGNWLVGCRNEALLNADVKEGTVGIADYAFYNCFALNTINLPESVKYIGRAAFYGCATLTYVNVPYGVTEIKDFTFFGCATLPGITIPNTVTSIGYSAFNKCYGLQTVTLPDSVKSIDDYSFYKCTALTTIDLGKGLTSIGNRAFYGSALTEINIPDSVTSIGTRVFNSCIALTNVTIGSGLKNLSNYTFYGCSTLASVAIPYVETIGDYAFRNCVAMTSIDFGNSLKTIGRYAFHGCTGLTSVVFPQSLTRISDYAFRTCSSLNSITITNALTSMGMHVFNASNNLTVYCEYDSAPKDWIHWNSSYRPVVWGVETSQDKTYVVSFVKSSANISNANAVNGIAAPSRVGYDFGGWTTVENGTTEEYTMETLLDAPDNTKLYAIWTEKAEQIS